MDRLLILGAFMLGAGSGGFCVLLDKQMSIGRISPDLPYIREKAVEVLKVTYTTREVAEQSITSEIIKFYQSNYPEIDGERGPR
jgi:hypothetical protein